MRDELQRNPTLLGLEKLMSALLPLVTPDVRTDVELSKSIIAGLHAAPVALSVR